MVLACGVLVVNNFAVLRHPEISGGEEEKGGGLLLGLGGESTQCSEEGKRWIFILRGDPVSSGAGSDF